MSNREKLKNLLLEVFLLQPDEFRFDCTRDEIDTWDSLGVVSLAVGIQETFGYHLAPDEAVGLASFQDIINLLEQKNINLND